MTRDDIEPSDAKLDLPEWHKELLDERERLVQEGKAKFIDWETAKQQIREEVTSGRASDS